ncbi:hypothetical protein HPP92_016799 [Vanilla planifolia]|uniref:Uncharacterized protein n=1 Tax=Vanilla planifolia TaxID=51239 RepID=A0A835USF0_VANPL|nr:hypothetical protein HPP92_017429 [Vanilla planifolia]KAG0472253.1 hypothetical protein HPP92_016799 [Vanilla planifolia]
MLLFFSSSSPLKPISRHLPSSSIGFHELGWQENTKLSLKEGARLAPLAMQNTQKDPPQGFCLDIGTGEPGLSHDSAHTRIIQNGDDELIELYLDGKQRLVALLLRMMGWLFWLSMQPLLWWGFELV